MPKLIRSIFYFIKCRIVKRMSWTDVQFSNVVPSYQIAGDSTGQYLIAAVAFDSGHTGGVYYSNNGGASWGPASGVGITAYAVASSSNGAVMYASANIALGPLSPTGIYKSIDGGEHWTQIPTQPGVSGQIKTITCNSDGDLNSLIILSGGSVWSFNGTTWTENFDVTYEIQAIGRDNTITPNLTVIINIRTGSHGSPQMYHSTDNGGTWTFSELPTAGGGGAAPFYIYSSVTFGNGICYIGSAGTFTTSFLSSNGLVQSCSSANIAANTITWAPVTATGYFCNNIQIFGDQLYILSGSFSSLASFPPSSGLGGLINVNLGIPGAPVTADPFITNNNYNCVNIYVSEYSGLRFLSVNPDTDGYSILRSNNNICFKEGTKILCLVDNKEVYLPIETITPGTLVKTSLDGYKKVDMIGSSKMYNPGNTLHSMKRLYVCKQANYPELLENLVLTGDHSILVPDITEKQRADINEYMGRIFVTDRKYRLMACLDSRAEPYTEEGIHTIWNLALENESYYGNYGIYANGLLVETCSRRMIKEMSGIELIE